MIVCLFFKQKTAYEMRISDWSSDVCSSDLDMDEKLLHYSLEKFNSNDNVYGDYAKIFIGSKKIEEGLDVKSVQHLFIASMPTDIPSLIQVIGRVYRKGRTEERRVGQVCVSTCRSRWQPIT